MTTTPTRDAWLPQVERLVAAYRAIGVRSAEVLELRVTDLTPRLAEAVVRWRLIDGVRQGLYDFDAGVHPWPSRPWERITAIAHNETPRLRASIERQRLG